MAKKLSFTAICMALSILCLFGASVAPTAKIALLAVSSVFCAIVISEYGSLYGFLHYLGVSLLALLLAPDRLYPLAYLLLLGYYPLIKLWIERVHQLAAEWILKLVCFNIVLFGLYFLSTTLLAPVLAGYDAAYGWVLQARWWIALAANAVFVAYDLALSFVLTYYRQRLRSHLKLIQS